MRQTVVTNHGCNYKFHFKMRRKREERKKRMRGDCFSLPLSAMEREVLRFLCDDIASLHVAIAITTLPATTPLAIHIRLFLALAEGVGTASLSALLPTSTDTLPTDSMLLVFPCGSRAYVAMHP